MPQMMDKNEIAEMLEEIAWILEIKGENPFKVRAYYNAARVLEGLTDDLDDLIRKNRLTELKGIGKNLADHIMELRKTGRLREYEKIIRSVPKGIFEILKIPGLGPKKVKILWEKLNVTDIACLTDACRKGVVAALGGFGEKTQSKILEGITQVKKHAGQFLYPVALEAAQTILEKIEKHPKVARASIAGSLRRCKEVARDIDLVVATDAPEKVMDLFVRLPQVERVVAHGETKSAVLLGAGMQADLRCVSDREFPCALHHFTGSKEHNVAMRALAQSKKMKMNEYGLFAVKGKTETRIPCRDETEIYARLGMEYIPPELRENMGEIEAAQKHELPKLIEAKDIRGVFHCHSTWSDGTASIQQMAEGTAKLGLEYIGMADHSAVAKYAGGLTPERVKAQFREIDTLNKKRRGVRIFKGIEADILPDGEIDMGERVLSTFDYVVASVHSKFNMSGPEMTKRVIKAVKNRYVRMLGHMTGRLLLQREGFSLDFKQVIQACADCGVAIEINANPLRLDIDWRHIPYAKEKGVTLVINPDAHSVGGLACYQYGVGIARKGWLEKKDVLNTRSRSEIVKWLNR